MKTLRLIVAFALIGFSAALLQAGDSESKSANCCAKAEAKGEKCSHGCCVEAAKAGKNCEKCGGKGDVAKKEEAKS